MAIKKTNTTNSVLLGLGIAAGAFGLLAAGFLIFVCEGQNAC